MGKHNKKVQTLFIFLILCITTSIDGGSVNATSLWGKKVDFMQKDCGYWELKNEHKIPTLKELSVCVNIKREVENSEWTAFMYLDPNKKDIQLGMKGYGTDLHIIMFDRVWISSSVVSLKTWHSVCMTWSKVMTQPVVYVNKTKVDLMLQSKKTPLHPNCCTVNGGGSLTLAVTHSFVEDKLVIETGTELKGSLSLFRLWKHVRSAQEISETACSDGDVLHWEERIWMKDPNCQPKQDVTQQCVWPFYEVNLPFIIIREDGNKTDIYDAREVAHQWLTQALAEIQLTLIDIYLHKVRVFPLVGPNSQTYSTGNVPFLKTSIVVMSTAPGLSQFKCLAHLNVIPSAEVGKMQDNLTEILSQSYEIDHYKIFTEPGLIFVYPLDDLLPTTTQPTTTKIITTTETTTTTPQPTTTEMITTTETTTTSQPTTTKMITTTETTTTTPQPTTTEMITTTETTTTSQPTTTEMITTTETTTTSQPTTTEMITTTETTTTTPQPTTKTTEMITTAKTTTTSQPTTTEMITTAETTTTTSQPTTTEMITTAETTPEQIETTTTVAASSTETTITTSTPFMETTVHTESSSAIKKTTVLTSLTTLTLSTTTYSTVSPEGIMTDSFFNVNVNVTIEGSTSDSGSIIQIWLNETLSSKGISVLNFKLMSSSTRAGQRGVETKKVTRHSCFFHAEVTTSSNVAETQNQIHSLLEQKYTSGSIQLDARPEDIFISYIGPCPEHNHYTRKGLFKWPQTSIRRITQLPCEGNPEKTAYRECLLDVNALWKSPDLGQCQLVVHSVSDLEDITVTNDNAEDILIMIEDLIHENKNLDGYELLTVLNKLADVINVSVITPPLGEVIINITSEILQSNSDLLPFTNSILNITESVGDQMLLVSGEDSVSLTAPAMAISVVNVDQEHFHNLTFGVSSTKGFKPEIYINQEPFDGTVAFISLPSEIQERFPIVNNTSPRVQFQFYGVPTLFQTKDDPDGKKLNTYVVSASVTNATGPIENLKEYVTVTLHHLKTKTNEQDVQCVFWDFSQNDGYGGWNPKGCWTYNISSDYTTCQCDHMTHFGVLVDVSRTPMDEENERILTLITYIGCGVSSCFLGITVLTYTLLEKLRRDYPSKILLNLSFALLGLNLVFLLNSWVSSFGIYGLCIAVAATLHYFLLTSFTWMGLGAVNMYFALVKVFNVYVPSYILKFCLLGWGIPLIICGLVLAVNKDSYGMSDFQEALDDSEMFCWVQNNVVFYVSVVSYIAFILLCNGSIFLVVLIQIRNMQVNQPAGTRSGILKDLRAVASLTFLLGLTWSVAFLAWGPVRVFFLYLFSILNSLQGFFIFVFHCLMKENVRKQWRIHLCCGVFKLQEHSEWSQTATVVPKHKPNPPHRFSFMASVRSIKSNSTQSSTVSSESSQCQLTITRPELGFAYENSLVIPRARTGQSPLSHDASPSSANGFEFPSKPWKNGFNTEIYPE